ncbi:MAG: hypothetical protein KAS62_05085 [Candidatus Delongbacteria bacterium]|nr:hypothetical protein [Candidatus Delongbacteria bacterium]
MAKKQKKKDIEEKEAFKELECLKKACNTLLKNKIQLVDIDNDASIDARLIFSIKTKSELLVVIKNFKKDELTFVNKTTKKKTREIPPPDVYAFYFSYNLTDGYFAFYKSAFTGKWIIKSFHHKHRVEETALGEAFKKAGIKTGKERS